MFRIPTSERTDWRNLADEYGFKFHTMYGQAYWDESAYYQFSLQQIEEQLEAPTEEIHQMCLHVADKVLADEKLMKKFQIPREHWDFVKTSWTNNEPSLYSRLDLAYNGKSPAKLFENNADTPTSLYETGFWQWLWLENKVDAGVLHRNADQFNSLQEKLIHRFEILSRYRPSEVLHFSCCKDTEEDRGTVQYLEDCAAEAGIETEFIYIEDIGESEEGGFTNAKDEIITWMFKLYPWEFMLNEDYSRLLKTSSVNWLEPAWKSIISNKALLPILWQLFPNHPNLLPAYFEEDMHSVNLSDFVKKPIFAREGANISIYKNDQLIESSEGPYGAEGYIYQAYAPLPKFGNNHTLIGSWLVDDKAAGIAVREDLSLITQDLSRYLPHIILS